MSGHTKGPWGIEATSNNIWIGPMRPDGAKASSVVVSVDDDPDYRADVREIRAANARLIAVAPCLLEAGRELADAAEQYENEGERRRNNRLLLAIEAFRAAITRADGGEK